NGQGQYCQKCPLTAGFSPFVCIRTSGRCRMTHVATLISNPGTPALDDAILAGVRGKLRGATLFWLAPGVAADVCFTPDAPVDDRMLAGQLRSALAAHPIDVVVQPSAHRRKRLLLAAV